MTEHFGSRAQEVTAPARRGFTITASDTLELAAETRAIFVGSAGDLSVVLSSGDAVTFVGLSGGALLPVRVKQVKATGTSATHLVGLY